jgi:hypothetical protein
MITTTNTADAAAGAIHERRHGHSIDDERCERVLREGSFEEIQRLRAEIIVLKKDVEGQFVEDDADLKERRAELLRTGMHPREAEIRAIAEGDADWRARALGFLRVIDRWLVKIKVRLREIAAQTPSLRAAAVVLPGCATTGEVAAAALNQLIAGGANVLSVVTIGRDLVVIAKTS